MDRFINTITGAISTLFGKNCRQMVVVGVAIQPESLRLHARFCRMRHTGATREGIYSAALCGAKPSLMPATAWQQPGQSSRRTSPVSWRSAWRRWFAGARAKS